MDRKLMRTCGSIALAVLVGASAPRIADAGQKQSQPKSSTAPQQRGGDQRLGVEAFGGAGISWPIAKESLEAAGFDSPPVEFGGGMRVTRIWRKLFAQVAGSRWSDAGERSFIDSTITRFPLGIPLNVKATYLDVSAGWKADARTRAGKAAISPYVGAGAGIVLYSEASPFAEPGDDVDTRSPSYHVLAGIEIPLIRWLAVAVDGRYRFVPNLLGKGGVSATLGEKTLGGLQANLGLRAGFGGGPRPRVHVPPRSAPVSEPQTKPITSPARSRLRTGIIVDLAPVFVLPDPNRTPLSTLTPGTTVRILKEAPDWIQVEFSDPQIGPRVGYVHRKYLQIKP